MTNNNPFILLGFAATFEIDTTQLHQSFIALCSANHPDRFTDLLDQADAANRTAQINDAYRCLLNPESRANTLLTLLGGSAKEQDKSLPANLLMEMMEVREQQEEAHATNDLRKLRELAQWAKEQRADYLTQIGDLFAKSQSTDASTNNKDNATTLKEIRLALNVLRYFERMLEQLPNTE